MNEKKRPELEKSAVIRGMPLVCGSEPLAVEFFEKQRWGDSPKCPHCQASDVYQMNDRNGSRNKRFLWRCRACGDQFTVRTGTIYEETRLPLRHWAYAFWKACSSKKGISALQLSRELEITHKSALFLLNRIRHAVVESPEGQPPLDGTLEIDETYIGGKPRVGADGVKPPGTGYRKDSNKVPVVAMVQREGTARLKVVPSVTQGNLFSFINKNVHPSAVCNTDQSQVYFGAFWQHLNRHDIVNHSKREYARHNPDGTVSSTNCAESLFSLLKRGLTGTFHAVSPQHLHRYCAEFQFRWDTRKGNDGKRLEEAVKRSEGKRLKYEDCVCREPKAEENPK